MTFPRVWRTVSRLRCAMRDSLQHSHVDVARLGLPIAGLATVVMWPVGSMTPAPGADEGWVAGLGLARLHGLRFGSDLVFTYGPLGFALFPSSISRSGLIISGLTLFVLCGAFALLTFTLLHRHVARTSTAVVGTAVITLLAPSSGAALCDVVVVAVFATMVDLVRAARPIATRWFVALAGLAAVLLLAKVSTGVVTVVGLGLLCLGRGWSPRRLGAAAGTFIATFVVLWVLLGQAPGDIWSWFRDVERISSGYSGAMVHDEPNRSWELVFVAVTALVLFALVTSATRRLIRNRASRRCWSDFATCSLLLGGLFFFVFKEGFVRHDVHAGIFLFAVAYLLATLPRWRDTGAWRPALASTLVFAVLALWTSGNTSLSTALDPTPSARSFLATVEQLTSRSSWRASLVAGRSAAQTHYAIGDTILKSVRGRSVHIEPHDVAAVWAHGLEWNPPPVFQRYSAWTPELDARNAAHLWSRAGPQRVLRSTDAPIDSRFDLLDGPLSMRALLCGHRPVAQTDRWQALAKVDTTRCSDPDPVARVHAAADAAIAIPAVDATRQAILVSIEYERNVTDDLATFLYRDDQYWIDFDGARFRLVPASAGVPGLVYVPPSSGWDEPFRVLPRVPHELTLDHRAEVVFYVLDVAGA